MTVKIQRNRQRWKQNVKETKLKAKPQNLYGSRLSRIGSSVHPSRSLKIVHASHERWSVEKFVVLPSVSLFNTRKSNMHHFHAERLDYCLCKIGPITFCMENELNRLDRTDGPENHIKHCQAFVQCRKLLLDNRKDRTECARKFQCRLPYTSMRSMFFRVKHDQSSSAQILYSPRLCVSWAVLSKPDTVWFHLSSLYRSIFCSYGPFL